MRKSRPFICLLVLFFAFSCEKVEDTIVKISVRDVLLQPVVGAEVTLFSQPGDSVIEEIENTNAAGDAVFDLSSFYGDGQQGLFVLNVEVDADSLSTSSIIQVIPQEVNELTLTLQ